MTKSWFIQRCRSNVGVTQIKLKFASNKGTGLETSVSWLDYGLDFRVIQWVKSFLSPPKRSGSPERTHSVHFAQEQWPNRKADRSVTLQSVPSLSVFLSPIRISWRLQV